jgi:hypothetical protein
LRQTRRFVPPRLRAFLPFALNLDSGTIARASASRGPSAFRFLAGQFLDL